MLPVAPVQVLLAVIHPYQRLPTQHLRLQVEVVPNQLKRVDVLVVLQTFVQLFEEVVVQIVVPKIQVRYPLQLVFYPHLHQFLLSELNLHLLFNVYRYFIFFLRFSVLLLLLFELTLLLLY